MRTAWLTDIHLNFLDEILRYQFYEKILSSEIDNVFLTGDIAEASSISFMLLEMEKIIDRPIYFIMGNHDYYQSDIETVRNEIRRLTMENHQLNWLPATGPIQLKKEIYLVGQDGWADGRFGDYDNSPITMTDSQLIADLYTACCLGKKHLLEKMQELAEYDCQQLKVMLHEAIRMNPALIIILLHVPPFKENCMQKGAEKNKYYLPFYTSQVTGAALLEMANSYPDIQFLVLCGHVHQQSSYQPCPNLISKSGQAEYYSPRIAEIIDYS